MTLFEKLSIAALGTLGVGSLGTFFLQIYNTASGD
jgi:hypothetical protein